jgi:putative membrane protein insertion efficiency factor
MSKGAALVSAAWTRRRAALLVTLVLVALLAADLSRAPDSQLTGRALVIAIHGYQRALSPVVSTLGGQCRFRPSCSHYAETVIARHGALEGSRLAAWRVLRCGPWTPMGTIDPPK